LAVEALEDRSVPSTVAYGDFNKDGRMDRGAITAPTTITISLANPDGSYTVSATLSSPSNRPVQQVYAVDHDGDGNLDIVATSQEGKQYYSWLGAGDGTFGSRHADQWKPGKGWF